ncbi:hypothetical protein N9H39_07835, partial [Gammaproteobacteria bacterium]|nr:hypothetical protein [Gammaproteobacteria bacterium]
MSRKSFRSLWAFFAFFLMGAGAYAQTLDSHPLAPADTSSPRATLRSFVTAIDKGLTIELKSALLYLASDRLYPNDFEKNLRAESDGSFVQALETLDFSGLPSGFREVLAVEQVILLSEILSRLDLPSFEAIPDYAAMKALGEKRWTIPNTRIEIRLIEAGPRQGEYVFSAPTVVRLREYYDRVAELPYKPGTLQRFVEGFRPYTSATTLFDIYRNLTTGFGVVPGRWMLSRPAWLTERFGGVAVWQWLGLLVYLLLAILFIFLARFFCRKTGASPQWRGLLTAVVVAVFAGLMVPLCGQLHISGSVLYVT